ncbi:MAG: sialidase family protein, partial [Casimicrobiaceae bacterium]
MARPSLIIRATTLAIAATASILTSSAWAAAPVPGPNVNMVSGTRWPEGDPFLTKQNEPAIAVSSRNARHLLAASNDYRLIPVEVAEELDDPEAWITIYKSLDGGATWRASPLGGCPIAIPACTDPITKQTAALKALRPNFGADPTMRPGPFGTFFLSFIAGTRDTGANGVVAVQRFVDKNNDIQRETDVRGVDASGNPLVRYAQDPILPDALAIVDTGTGGQFKDKPWVVADVPGRSWNAGKTCELLTWTKTATGFANVAETVPAFNVYVSWANFVGDNTNPHPQINVAVSSDCGKTFAKPFKPSNPLSANSGSSLALDPLTGAVYVAWRNFDGPDAIYVSNSTDGGKTWSKKPIRVANFITYDQAATGASFRTLAFPTVAVSVAGNTSRVHVAWTQRKAAVGATSPYACSSSNPADCDTRIVMSTSLDAGTTWRTPQYVDSAFPNPLDTTKPGRGHQLQPALTFAAGKLLLTWLDQRLDHTEGVLVKNASDCPVGTTCSPVGDQFEYRAPKGNLAPNCSVDVNRPEFANVAQNIKDALATCRGPGMAASADAVWTTYATDGTPGLVRRHTVDVFASMADPADTPSFASARVSQYTYGNQVELETDAAGNPVLVDGKYVAKKGLYPIVQKEVNAPNLPMFGNGTAAFLGDYIDAAAQTIVASGSATYPYKFNVGGATVTGNFTANGLAPVFHVAFTDNRDVIAPTTGDWRTPT